MSSLEDKQAALVERLRLIDEEMSRADNEFLTLAAEFNSQDGTASLKAAEQVEQRLSTLRREKALTIASQAHVTKQQLDEKAQQAEADRRALLATAKQHADAVITLNSEIDEHLTKLRQLFERRFALLSQLGATGVVEQAFITKLQSRAGPTRAMCASGLAKFVSLEKVATQSWLGLSSVNPILLGIGKDTNGVVSAGNNSNGGPAPAPRGRVLGAEADEEVT
jgi:hypothetical protein